MKLKYLALSASLMCMSSANAAISLLSNHDFENPDVVVTETNVTLGGLTDWTVGAGPNTAQVNLIDGDFFGLNITNSVAGSSDAFEGNQYIAFNASDTAAGGFISQNLTTIIGQQYQVEFSIAGGDFTGSSHQIIADAGGGLGGLTQAATNNAWTTHSFNFTATGTSTLITFTDDLQSGGTSSDLLLDAVHVTAVPEPTSMALLGLGSLSLLLRRRKQ